MSKNASQTLIENEGINSSIAVNPYVFIVENKVEATPVKPPSNRPRIPATNYTSAKRNVPQTVDAKINILRNNKNSGSLTKKILNKVIFLV